MVNGVRVKLTPLVTGVPIKAHPRTNDVTKFSAAVLRHF